MLTTTEYPLLALEAVAAELVEMAKPPPKVPVEQPQEEPVKGREGEQNEEGGDDNQEERGEEEEEPAEEEAPEEPIELPESLKPFLEAAAVLKVWTAAFVDGSLGAALLKLRGYVLPCTASMKALLLLVADFCGVEESLAEDVFAEKSWDRIRQVPLSS